MDNRELNFVRVGVDFDWADKLLDGNPASGYNFRFFTEKHTMAHIMHWSGMFESVTLARKNGWDRPIPLGFTFLPSVGKRKLSIAIVNTHPDDIHEPQ